MQTHGIEENTHISKKPKRQRPNRKIQQNLGTYDRGVFKGEQEDCDLNLGCLATPSSSVWFTPNMLMLGREIRISAEQRSGRANDSDGPSVNSYGEYVSWLGDRLQAAHDVAREHLENAAKRHKYAYDTKLEHLRYEQGKFALYLHEKRVPGVSSKLQPKYVLCVVLKKLSDVTYLIRLEEGGNSVVHLD